MGKESNATTNTSINHATMVKGWDTKRPSSTTTLTSALITKEETVGDPVSSAAGTGPEV